MTHETARGLKASEAVSAAAKRRGAVVGVRGAAEAADHHRPQYKTEDEGRAGAGESAHSDILKHPQDRPLIRQQVQVIEHCQLPPKNGI